MSGRLLTLAWEVPDLPPSTRLVFMALADCADREGRNAFPSVRTMAGHCALSERTVQNALAELRERGLIVVQTPPGFRRSTTYRLFPEGAAFAPLLADKGAAVAPSQPSFSAVMGADMGADMGAGSRKLSTNDPGEPGERRAARGPRHRPPTRGGRCAHVPMCQTITACIQRTIEDARGQAS